MPKSRDYRVITDLFDYNSRRDLGDIGENVSHAMGYLSRLRFDSLIYRKIVLTDVQMLHSVFFSSLGLISSDRVDIFDRIPFGAIEVRTRSLSLRQSIVELVKPKSNGDLIWHLFTYIDPTGFVSGEISGRPGSEVGKWQDVPDLIIEIARGTPAAERARRAKESWKRLIREEDRLKGNSHDVLTRRKWKRLSHFNDLLGQYFRAATSAELVRTEFGIEEYKKVLSGKTRGQFASDLMRQDEKRTISEEEYSDLVYLDSAYSVAYNAVLAKQHKCDLQETNGPNSVVDNNTVAGLEGVSSTKIPSWFMNAMAEIPSGEFSRFRDDSTTRLSRWRDKGNEVELERFVEELVRIAESRMDTSDYLLHRASRSRLGRGAKLFSASLQGAGELVKSGADAKSSLIGAAIVFLVSAGMELINPEGEAGGDCGDVIKSVSSAMELKLLSAIDHGA